MRYFMITIEIINQLRFFVKRCLIIITILLVFFIYTTWAQTISLTDGATPLGITAGAPAGSYALSGLDNINLFNGSINFSIPLLRVGVRGGAGYTMMLPIEQRWSVERDYIQYPSNYTDGPTPNPWKFLMPGYGPGVLVGRHVAREPIDCTLYGIQERYQTTLTRLTFITPDGTEFEMRDQLTEGEPLISTACLVDNSRG